MISIIEYNRDDSKKYERLLTTLKQLADEIHFFCPTIDKGLCFYNQSPSGIVAKLTGTLPERTFLSSGHKLIEWNEEYNGKKESSYPINNELSLITSIKKVRDGESSHKIITIIVSPLVYRDLILQITNPVIDEETSYEIHEIKGKIIYYPTYEKDNKIKNNIVEDSLYNNIDIEYLNNNSKKF